MSEASSDFHPPPRPVVPLRRVRTVPRSRRADEQEEVDSRLDAALSLHNPVYPLDPPIVDVRIPVEAPHSAATRYSCDALRHQFPSAEVGDDLHMLFSEPDKAEEEGQSRLAPDIFVALNVPRESDRDDYDADALGPPDFVLEVLSRSTWEHDLGRKLDCYQQIGVRECLLFDATGAGRAREGVGPLGSKELWGYALTPKHREPLGEVALPNGERAVRSDVLGLVAYVRDRMPPSGPHEVWALTMRWHDPATGTDIPDYSQSRAETRTERTRADAAERRVAELEEQLRRRDGS